MGLFDFLKSNSDQPAVDLSDFKFISNDHIRYENGQDVSGHNYDCWRGVRVQTNISGSQGYTVTMYNLDGNHPVWGNNIQMAPKQMKVIEQNSSTIKLRGYGADTLGNSFSDYGLTLHLERKSVNKVTLHLYDRNIEIIYFNASDDKSILKTPDKKDESSLRGIAEILSYSEKIQKRSNLQDLRNLFNEKRTFNHPTFYYDFGIAFIQQDDKENAKKALIKGALFGIKYPCEYYDSTIIDSVGQCISTLLTYFTFNDNAKIIKLSALAFTYLSRCIELQPNLSYDSYKSRGYMMLSLNIDYAVDNFFIPKMPLPGIQILSSMSDLYYAATISGSPHKKWLSKSLEMFQSLKNYNVAYKGRSIHTFTIEEICEYGFQVNQQLFKKIELDYMAGRFDMMPQEILSI